MDPRADGSTFQGLPRAFINKRGEPILVHHLEDNTAARLIEMYLAFPRACFQGLPPLKDESCVHWVQGMTKDAVNLVALSFERGVVGHTAVFPMDNTRCEMLVAVAPAYQNTGIGTELIRSVVQLAYDLGFQQIWLPVESTNTRARHVYKKCGFDQLPRRGSGEVEMALDLKRYRGLVDVCVGSIMNRSVVTIGPDEPCRRALELLLEHRLSALPVVDADGQFQGLLSQTDFMQPLNLEKQVRDLVTRNAPTVQEDQSVTRVIRMLQSSRIRCLPVVDADRRLQGIVSRREVLAHYARHV